MHNNSVKKFILIFLFIAIGSFVNAQGIIYTVNTTSNHDDHACTTGDCTLREAINAINAGNGGDTIKFNIVGPLLTISPDTALPKIIKSVVIDGTSQPGFAGTPIIEISGANVNCNIGASLNGLALEGISNSSIKGILINRFWGADILVSNSQNCSIQGNYFGTDVTGTIAIGNRSGNGCPVSLGGGGISISSSKFITIGGAAAGKGNLISGSAELLGFGVAINNSEDITIIGNYIGVNVSGTSALANYCGVSEGGVNKRIIIGGSEPGERNIISGNITYGIAAGINRSTYEDTVCFIRGNYIGTDAAGKVAIPNISGIYVGGEGVQIGGMGLGERNLISGNSASGIIFVYLDSYSSIINNYIGTDVSGNLPLGNQGAGIFCYADRMNAFNNVISANSCGIKFIYENLNGHHRYTGHISGNYIGVGADGTTPLGNTTDGIRIESDGFKYIGDGTPEGRNIISANGRSGIHISGNPSTAPNFIKGNYLGPDKNGNKILGSTQEYGLYLTGSASGNNIGGAGDSSSQGNTIAFNTVDGIYIDGASSHYNLISRNLIYDNNGNGIELNYGSNQGNDGKPKPIVILADDLSISGTGSPTDSIEIFSSRNANDPLCNKAEVYLGTVVVDSTGNWLFDKKVSIGKNIKATARTVLDSNTSEFSDCMKVIPAVFSVEIKIDYVGCNGNEVSAIPRAGTAPYIYTWFPGNETSQSLSGLSKGSYTLTVADSLGTHVSKTFTITPHLPKNIIINQSKKCEKGDATINIIGNTSPYSYLWQPGGETNQSVSNLSAGTYTVIIKDKIDCVDTLMVIVHSLPTILSAPDITLCEGDSAILTASGAANFMWKPGAALNSSTGASVRVSAITLRGVQRYTLTGTDSNGCKDSTYVKVTVTPPPIVEISPDLSINIGASAILTSSAGNSFLWSPSTGIVCTSCQNTAVTPKITGKYYLTVTDKNGCETIDSVSIYVSAPCGVTFVPGAFSPNNDEKNDTLLVRNPCLTDFTFSVFNRWGEEVFKSTNINKGWDGTYNGKELNPDIFVWYLSGLDNLKPVSIKGTVSLIK